MPHVLETNLNEQVSVPSAQNKKIWKTPELIQINSHHIDSKRSVFLNEYIRSGGHGYLVGPS